MKISIGIFAYNESPGIANMLHDLFLQDLIRSASESGNEIEIICLPNGCTDDTADVSRKAIKREIDSLELSSGITWRVDELAIAGKANAWNYYVHSASASDADYLICLDADIALPQKECLSRVVDAIAMDPDAYVAVDDAKKVFDCVPSTLPVMTWFNKLITKEKKDSQVIKKNAIAGSLFCGRTAVLRKVWLPKGLVRVMDGFVKAMVITNCFTTSEEHFRIIVANDCYHTFKAYNSITKLFIHNRNLLVGMSVNAMIYDYLWEKSTPHWHAGEIIHQLNENEPDWLTKIVLEKMTLYRRFSLLKGYISSPLKKLKVTSFKDFVRRFPVALIYSIIRIPVAIAADRNIRRKRFDW